MSSRVAFVVIAWISLIAVVKSAAPPPPPPGGPGCHKNLTVCCPTLPAIVKEASLKSCMPPRPEPPQGSRPPPPAGSGSRPQPPPPQGSKPPPPAGSRPQPPPPPFGGNLSCAMECAFKLDGFVSSTTSLVDLDVLNTYLTTLATGEWASIMTEAQANCTAAAPVVMVNSICTSGACEVMKCLNKYLMAKCPSLVNSADCTRRVQELNKMCTEPTPPPSGAGGFPPPPQRGPPAPPPAPSRSGSKTSPKSKTG